LTLDVLEVVVVAELPRIAGVIRVASGLVLLSHVPELRPEVDMPPTRGERSVREQHPETAAAWERLREMIVDIGIDPPATT
jgi:hypothetical protein